MQPISHIAGKDFDIAVIGAGPAGLAAGLAFARHGFNVCVFGPRPDAIEGRPDTRTAALLGRSAILLHELGVWEPLESEAAPLKSLTIIDQTGRLLRAPDITFHASEIGLPAFGYNIPNRTLTAALFAALAAYERAFAETAAVTDIFCSESHAILQTAEGQKFAAPLAVGADGRASLAREKAGIGMRQWDYGHTAIACSFEHEAAHEGRCVELHRTGGPFTCVPMPGNSSSLVWVEKSAMADDLMRLDDRAFATAIEAKIGTFLGRVASVGPRSAFPLSALAVHSYGRNRIALVGEAAHVVPPIGAQGLNLGFRDVAALAEAVMDARKAGHDIGSKSVLSAYSARRSGDVLSRTLAADLLNRTLIGGFAPFDAARGLGLAALNTIPALRRFMMRQGIGPHPGAAEAAH